jgi:hypothetical protein
MEGHNHEVLPAGLWGLWRQGGMTRWGIGEGDEVMGQPAARPVMKSSCLPLGRWVVPSAQPGLLGVTS